MLPDDLQVLVPYKDLVALLELSQRFEGMEKDVAQMKRELDGCRALISQTQAYAKDIERQL